jgi:hypothetical protein
MNEFSVRQDQLDQGFSLAFLNHRANAELVPKFHVALFASRAAFPMVTSKSRPNVALPMSTSKF